jgi:peptidoglycan hydrolase-like protein with peptidoglycan-binding domain
VGLRIPGYQWIGSNTTSGNDYVDNGQQPKILLHMTVSTSLSMGYAQSHKYPPQSWASPYTGDRWQSIELDRAGLALYQPPYNLSWMNKNWFCSQTELVGYPVVNQVTYTEDQSRWIGENVIAPIWQALQSVGVNVNLDNYRYHTDSSGSASEYWGGRMGDEEYFNFNGVLCHIDAFGNDHWDCSVERVDKWVAYAKQFLGQGGGVPITPPDTGGGGGGSSGNPGNPAVGGWPGVYLVNYTEHASVTTWQNGMNAIGYALSVDGGYGPQSERACIQLQASNGLDSDGVVGPNTWDVTFGGTANTGGGGSGTPGTSAPAWPGVYLSNYTSDPSALTWQQQMANRGWDIAVDGEYGPASEEVCIQFQQEKGLDADGVVGPLTWEMTWSAPIT